MCCSPLQGEADREGSGETEEQLCRCAAVIKEGKILNGKHSKEELAAWVEKVRNQ